jgi:hypothetical protein
MCPKILTCNNIKNSGTGCQWLTSEIQATWETEIERTKVQGQPEEIVLETSISKEARAK